MKTISNIEPAAFESTYALLMRSEEKHRSRFETFIYSLLIASSIFAVSQFGRETAKMPFGVAHVPMGALASPPHRT